MKRDDLAVAGFFEDLPVLMIVLGGTVCLVVSGTWASQRMAADDLDIELDALAGRLLEGFVAETMKSVGPDGTVMLSSFRAVNASRLSGCIPAGFGYGISAVTLFPGSEWVFAVSSEDGRIPQSAGISRTLLNALDDRECVIVVEVRAAVWKS